MALKKVEMENPTDFLQNNSDDITQRNIEIHSSKLLFYFLRGCIWKKESMEQTKHMEQFWLNIESAQKCWAVLFYFFNLKNCDHLYVFVWHGCIFWGMSSVYKNLNISFSC